MTKDVKKRVRYVTVPLFDQRVHFVTTMEDYNDCLASMGFPPAPPANGKGGWYTSDAGDVMFIVGVMNGLQSTLVHEIAHVVHFMCKYVGIRVGYGEVNETFCYMMGALYDLLNPLLNDANRKRAKKDAKKYRKPKVALDE